MTCWDTSRRPFWPTLHPPSSCRQPCRLLCISFTARVWSTIGAHARARLRWKMTLHSSSRTGGRATSFQSLCHRWPLLRCCRSMTSLLSRKTRRLPSPLPTRTVQSRRRLGVTGRKEQPNGTCALPPSQRHGSCTCLHTTVRHPRLACPRPTAATSLLSRTSSATRSTATACARIVWMRVRPSPQATSTTLKLSTRSFTRTHAMRTARRWHHKRHHPSTATLRTCLATQAQRTRACMFSTIVNVTA